MSAPFHRPEAEAGPEGSQPALRVSDDTGISLFLTKFQSGLDQLNGGAAVAVFLAHRDAFELGEIGEEAQPHAADRLIADIGQKMRGAEVIAVIFLFIRAFLFADIDGVADGGDAHQVVKRPGERDADVLFSGMRNVAVINGYRPLAGEEPKIGGLDIVDDNPLSETQHLAEAP